MTYKPFKMKGSPMHRNFGIGAENIRGEGRSERLQRKIEEAEKGGDSKRVDRLKDRESRLMDRFQRRAARLEQRGKLDKAQKLRDIEKEVYTSSLERDLPGTEGEITEDLSMVYDPSSRRTVSKRGKGVESVFDYEGYDAATDEMFLKKGKIKDEHNIYARKTEGSKFRQTLRRKFGKNRSRKY